MEIQKRAKELSWWVTLETAARIGSAFNPWTAIAANSVFTVIDQVRKKRTDDFLVSFETEIEEKFDQIKSDYVLTGDFQEIFLKCSIKIADERSELKRIAYKNILLFGAFNAPQLNDLEDRIKLLDQVGENQLRILHFLTVPGYINSNSMGPNIWTVLHEKFPDWERAYMEDIIGELESMVLIKDLSSSLGVMISSINAETFTNKVTRRGRRFIEFVLRS